MPVVQIIIKRDATGYYLDVSYHGQCDAFYDSFVPVEFGRFNGGVIDAKIKRFNADDSNVKLGYRTTRSRLVVTSHIDENNKKAHLIGFFRKYLFLQISKELYTLVV